MTGNTEEDMQGRTERTRERFNTIWESTDEEMRNKMSNTITVVGARSRDLRTDLQTLSSQTTEVVKPVLGVIQEHITENEINVTISGKTIHIGGDEAGLKRIDADLEQLLEEKNVHAEYDRESGISLDIVEHDP